MMLRHALATLAYRGAKAVRDAPDGFASFRAHPGTRTPGDKRPERIERRNSS